jgi:hypothetical protein
MSAGIYIIERASSHRAIKVGRSVIYRGLMVSGFPEVTYGQRPKSPLELAREEFQRKREARRERQSQKRSMERRV